MTRRQLSIPSKAREVLGRIPPSFYDDGCSNAPDSLFGFNFKWACRIHNWRYCTRAHHPGTMTQSTRRVADYELKQNIRTSLPWRWRWVCLIYRFFVWRYGGVKAFDSCDSTLGIKCRHNMTQPPWMQSLHVDD